MKSSEELEYTRLINMGNLFTKKAEQMYLVGKIFDAVKSYYHASVLYEQAKEIADTYLELEQKLFASEKEKYCLEKLDELKRFKGLGKEDVIR